MLDSKDIEAIQGLLDSQRRGMMKDVSLLMESKFQPQFNLLAENQQTILNKLIPEQRIEDLEIEVKMLRSLYIQLSEELKQLKATM